MSLEDARALYDHIRDDAELTRDLFRQALQDPQGTLQRLVTIAGERGLQVDREDVQRYLQDEAPGGEIGRAHV